MLGCIYSCDLKTYVQNLGYPPLQIGDPKTTFLDDFELNGNFNGLYLRNETRYRQSAKCVDNYTVMLSPRGQVGLEAKILSLSSKICPWPRSWPGVFVLDMSLNFSLGLVKLFVMLVLVIFLSLQRLVNCVTYLFIMPMVML